MAATQAILQRLVPALEFETVMCYYRCYCIVKFNKNGVIINGCFMGTCIRCQDTIPRGVADELAAKLHMKNPAYTGAMFQEFAFARSASCSGTSRLVVLGTEEKGNVSAIHGSTLVITTCLGQPRGSRLI